MLTNIALACVSAGLLGMIAFMAYKKRQSLSLVEVYAIMVGFYFGVWGMLDSLLQDLTLYNPSIIILVYVTVAISLFFTWYILRVFLPNRGMAPFLECLELSFIANIAAKVKQRYVALFVFILLLFKLYSIQKYNIVNNYDWDSLREYHVILPTWFILFDGMLRSLLFIALFPTAVGIFRAKGTIRVLWIIMAVIIFSIEAMYGRSSVFNFIIIFLLYWFVEKAHNRLSFGLVAATLISCLFLIMYSNFYQACRSIFIFKYGYSYGESYWDKKLLPALGLEEQSTDLEKEDELLNLDHKIKIAGNSATISTEKRAVTKRVQRKELTRRQKFMHKQMENLLSPQKSIDNFLERPAVWRFHYCFVEWQMNGGYQYVPYGALLKDAAIFMIPRMFWHDKPYYLLQPNAYKLYHLNYKIISDAPSIFSFVQIDFGFLTIFITPIFLLLGFLPTAYTLLFTAKNPVLFIIIAGEFGYYCVDIIRDYYGLFMYYRELMFLLLIYIGLSSIKLLALSMYKVSRFKNS